MAQHEELDDWRRMCAPSVGPNRSTCRKITYSSRTDTPRSCPSSDPRWSATQAQLLTPRTPLAASAGAVCHGRGAPQRPVRQRCSVPLTPPRRPASPGPACRTLSYFGCPQRQRLRPEPAASHESSPSVTNAPYPASGLVGCRRPSRHRALGPLPDPDKPIWTGDASPRPAGDLLLVTCDAVVESVSG